MADPEFDYTQTTTRIYLSDRDFLLEKQREAINKAGRWPTMADVIHRILDEWSKSQ